MFFIAYAYKGQVHVFAVRVNIVSHWSCRTSSILKYFCPLVTSTKITYTVSIRLNNLLADELHVISSIIKKIVCALAKPWLLAIEISKKISSACHQALNWNYQTMSIFLCL